MELDRFCPKRFRRACPQDLACVAIHEDLSLSARYSCHVRLVRPARHPQGVYRLAKLLRNNPGQHLKRQWRRILWLDMEQFPVEEGIQFRPEGGYCARHAQNDDKQANH